jgi:ABC-type multidrug transport system fused ATPase/permease subunit
MTSNFSGALYPYLFGKLVDQVFYAKELKLFLRIVFMYGLVYLLNQFMHFLLNLTWANLMTKFLFNIRKTIYEKVLSYGGKTLSSLYSGDIIYRMSADTEQFMNYIHWNTFYLVARIFNLIVSVGFIGYLSWPIAIFTLIITPVSVYTSRHFSKIVKKYYSKISENSGLLSSWLCEMIKGMQEIRLLSAGKGVLSDYVGKTIKIVRLQIKANQVEIVSERVNSGMSLIWQLVLYVISAFLIYDDNLTLGGFTACVSYFGTCISSFHAFHNHLAGIAGNLVSVDRICATLEEVSEDYKTNEPAIIIDHGKIDFDKVSFFYHEGINVLDKISFTVSPGEKVAIVGHSGAGKSTIANLILKLYELHQGEIRIDGIDISKCNLHSLRGQIGIVHQETALFEGTIRYNLIFSDDNTSDMRIFSALKKAHLYEFVTSLPEELDTVIGSNVRDLSGGQKQRLAIARIFLKNPKILIFDEATSSLDNEAEQIIKESWDQLCEGRTIVIIAHRLSTIISADKILVLHDHKIAGYDIHSNLLASCEVYSQLFKEQYSLQEGVAAHA